MLSYLCFAVIHYDAFVGTGSVIIIVLYSFSKEERKFILKLVNNIVKIEQV